MKLFVKSFLEHFIDETPFELHYVLRHTKNVKLLDRASNSVYFYIRQYIVANKNTTTKTLQKLAASESYWLRNLVAKHRNATEIVKRLCLMQTTKLRKNELPSTRLFSDL
jgi:23S rRNA A1618 N6-methylase RlmF